LTTSDAAGPPICSRVVNKFTRPALPVDRNHLHIRAPSLDCLEFSASAAAVELRSRLRWATTANPAKAATVPMIPVLMISEVGPAPGATVNPIHKNAIDITDIRIVSFIST